jgi:2-hydroxychromene-2-carboxylate isomerase
MPRPALHVGGERPFGSNPKAGKIRESMGGKMTTTIDAYWSMQSPYCYFALDRLMSLEADGHVSIRIRPVLPGVVRNPGAYTARSDLETDYFFLDCARTADFLGLPYGEADPYPVAFAAGTVWKGEVEQPRIWMLYNLFVPAVRRGKALAFLDKVMRLIWDGRTRNWHEGDHLAHAVAAAGLDGAELLAEAEADPESIKAECAANQEAMFAAGHWGVPLFVLDGEPFYGQDRFDQLLWRLART